MKGISRQNYVDARDFITENIYITELHHMQNSANYLVKRLREIV